MECKVETVPKLYNGIYNIINDWATCNPDFKVTPLFDTE